MKTPTIFQLVLLQISTLILTLPSFAQELPTDEKTKVVRSPRMGDKKYIRTTSAVDEWLLTSKIPIADIQRTGPRRSYEEAQPEGIGVLAAGQKALEAFKLLKLPNKKNFRLHGVKRKYTFAGWVYEAAFAKKSDNSNSIPSPLVEITILLDGTVIPVEIRKNGP